MPSPWAGGCQTSHFYGVLGIKCSFQHRFSELGLNSLWRWGNRKHEFCVVLDIPLSFHHECFSWIGTSTPSPCSMGMLLPNISFMHSSGHFKQFLGKNFFVNWPPHHTHEVGVVNMGFPYRSWHFFQLLAKIIFGKDPQSYLWGVKDQRTLLFCTYHVIYNTFLWSDLSTYLHPMRVQGWHTWLFCTDLDIILNT